MIPPRSRAAIALVPLLLAGAVSSPASADTSTADKAAAQTLFYEARALAEEGKWTEVCPKLEESERLDPRIVTLYRLADCYEHVGRTASAWVLYLDAASQARLVHEGAREKAAMERASALEPTLARLVIVAPEIPGMVIRRDGAVIHGQQVGLKVPVDPGIHTIAATAPGKVPFQAEVSVASGAGPTVVSVVMIDEPRPFDATSPLSTSDPRMPRNQAPLPATYHEKPIVEDTDRSSAWLVTGIVTFGVGVALAGSGVALLVDPSAGKCPCVLPAALLVTGAVATATGAAIWIAEAQARPAKRIAVSFGPTGVVVRGAF